MLQGLRRVVTGTTSDGRSVVVDDRRVPARRGFIDMWETDGAPVDLTSAPNLTPPEPELEPLANGTVFRFFQLPARSRTKDLAPHELEARYAETFRFLGAEHARPDTARHPGMHRTRTIDYVIVLRGRVRLLLDEGDVVLAPLDVVIQRGTNHAWLNEDDEPALLAGILVDAELPQR